METGFIYLWRDRKHNRYYIGCHWGTEDDGYICSSSWMKQGYKRRPQDFKRRIIQRNIERSKLLEEEYKWLQMITDEELGKKYYNLSKKHFGHWSNNPESHLTVREKLSKRSLELHQNPVYKQKYLEGIKKRPPQTKEQIQKRTLAITGKKRSEETKKKIGDAHRGKIVGPLSEETKAKLRERMSGEKNPFFGKTHSPESKAIMSEKISRALKGKMPKNINIISSFWWNNGVKNTRSPVCPGEGWIRGKIDNGCKSKISSKLKELWNDPIWREKILQARKK